MPRENITKLHTAAPAQFYPDEIEAIDERLADANALAEALASQDVNICIEGPELIRIADMIHREIEAARKLLAEKY